MRVNVGLSAAAALMAIGMTLSQPAAAQINPFRSSFASRISNDDFRMLNDAATSLLNREMLADGDSAVWSNPRTGSKGTVEITRSFMHGSYTCHRLAYTVFPKGGSSAATNTLNWCKTPKGWRIL